MVRRQSGSLDAPTYWLVCGETNHKGWPEDKGAGGQFVMSKPDGAFFFALPKVRPLLFFKLLELYVFFHSGSGVSS